MRGEERLIDGGSELKSDALLNMLLPPFHCSNAPRRVAQGMKGCQPGAVGSVISQRLRVSGLALAWRTQRMNTERNRTMLTMLVRSWNGVVNSRLRCIWRGACTQRMFRTTRSGERSEVARSIRIGAWVSRGSSLMGPVFSSIGDILSSLPGQKNKLLRKGHIRDISH